jgi:hypothetical protein
MAKIRVGTPDARPDSSAHVEGVEQGNRRRWQPGIHGDGTADARRSTGIRPHQHEPILPTMPNLPPG